MDAVKGFFSKYHAVPIAPTPLAATAAARDGPSWQLATDDALIGWVTADCNLWDRDPSAHADIKSRMGELAWELRRRNFAEGREGARCWRRAEAIMEVAGRIGWGWYEDKE